MADAGLDHDVPLCVDLDGTLIRSDTLHEAVMQLARHRPLALLSLPRWLMGGKAALKRELAERVDIGAAGLPYRAPVLDLIAQARAQGRRVVLATAAPEKVAQAIAGHLGLFDEVLASGDSHNLSARHKADALVARFGEGGFDYVGNHRDDLPVIAHARRGFLLCRPGGLRRQAARVHAAPGFLDPEPRGVRPWLKMLRVHQWLKNLLVFVPIAAGHQLGDAGLLGQAILAFVAFSLCASSVYIVNDLLDLSADRQHLRKRRRPFASGDVPIAAGVATVPLLLLVAAAIALTLPVRFVGALAGYFLLTSLYSFWLKRQIIVDVMLLAGLYTMRILAGAAATGIPPSFWLLGFSMFLFFCLAMVKRYSELRLAVEGGSTLAGRGYHTADLPVILALGTASGMVSVLILGLYTQAEIVPALYPSPEWLWLVPPAMFYWIARLWMKAQRGEVDDDPVVFAARDWQSLVVIAVMGALFLLAGTNFRPW